MGVCYHQVFIEEMNLISKENQKEFEKLILAHKTLYPFTCQNIFAFNVKDSRDDYFSVKQFSMETDDKKKKNKKSRSYYA